jgi:hypothetical protein
MRSPVSESDTEYSCTSGCHTCGLGTSLNFKPATIATPSPRGRLSNGTRKEHHFLPTQNFSLPTSDLLVCKSVSCVVTNQHSGSHTGNLRNEEMNCLVVEGIFWELE